MHNYILIAGFLCFLASAISWPKTAVNLTAAGLALITVAVFWVT